jgi:hypothetical protein
MPYLRCEECGARALSIATRCPACEAPFELGAGTANPEVNRRRLAALRPCRTCDSLIAPDAATCKWCDTPRPIRTGAGRTYLIGGSLVALTFTLWAWGPDLGALTRFLSGPSPSDSGDIALSATSEPERLDPLEDASFDVAPPAFDEIGPPADEANRGDVDRGDADGGGARAGGADPDVRASTSASLGADGWVSAVTRTFVNVRSGTGTDAPIVGVLSENAQVQLGARRGSWREVRAGSLSGWAFESLFVVDGG